MQQNSLFHRSVEIGASPQIAIFDYICVMRKGAAITGNITRKRHQVAIFYLHPSGMKITTAHIILKAKQARCCIALLLFSLHIVTQAQNADSLKQVAKTSKSDTARCRALFLLTEMENDMDQFTTYNNEAKAICEQHLKTLKPSDPLYPLYIKYLATVYSNIGYIYGERAEMDKAFEYNTKSLGLFQSALKNTTDKAMVRDIQLWIATCYTNISANYKQKGNIPLTIDYLKKALKIEQELDDKAGQARELSNLAYIHDSQGDVQKALEYNSKSLKLREEVNDVAGLSVTINNIGLIYSNQRNYPKALEYYSRALKLSIESGYGVGEARAYNNIGAVYLEEGKTELALDYFDKALKLRQKIGDQEGIGQSLMSAGAARKLLSDTKYKGDKQKQDSLRRLAMDNFYQSLNLREQIQDKLGSTISLINIAKISCDYKLGDQKKVKALADTALKNARELGYPDLIQRAANVLSLLYKQQGDYKNAYEMQVLFKQMSDSINNEANRKALTQKTMQYEFDKKEAAQKIEHEKEVVLLEAEHTNTKNIIIFLSAIALLLLIAVFGFYTFRKNLRLKAENTKHLLYGQEKERLRISKELHDGIGQHMLFLRNQLVKLNQETLVTSADETLEEVRTLSKNLYPNQLEKYGLIAAVDALIAKVKETTEIFTSHDLEAFKQELSPDQQIGFYRIIQECISNALKHASATAIRVTATAVGKGIELVIQDDGKGFDKQKLKQAAQRSFGVLNLEERVRIMNGTISLETSSGNGTKWTFFIPTAKI